jgi:hypothetical protein
MTPIQCSEFISKVLSGLWPKWKPTDQQVASWAKMLEPLGIEEARNAAQEYYGDKGSGHTAPRPREFKRYAKIKQTATVGAGRQRYAEPRLAYSLKCISHETNPNMVGRVYKFFSVPADFDAPPHVVEQWAIAMGRRVRNGYRGEWEYHLASGGSGPIQDEVPEVHFGEPEPGQFDADKIFPEDNQLWS